MKYNSHFANKKWVKFTKKVCNKVQTVSNFMNVWLWLKPFELEVMSSQTFRKTCRWSLHQTWGSGPTFSIPLDLSLVIWWGEVCLWSQLEFKVMRRFRYRIRICFISDRHYNWHVPVVCKCWGMSVCSLTGLSLRGVTHNILIAELNWFHGWNWVQTFTVALNKKYYSCTYSRYSSLKLNESSVQHLSLAAQG